MTVKQRMTAEDLWEMPETPGKRFELVRGELVEVPGAGGEHGVIVRVCMRLLDPYAVAHDLGEVFADGVGYTIHHDPDVVRIPDVSFVAKARVPQTGVPMGFWPFAPDLAVEIVSPTDRAEDVHSKVLEYLEAGTRLVWVLWPRDQRVTVYTSAAAAYELDADGVLDGGDVLPGFRAEVSEMFGVRK
ncbi:MAG: Uma2 family endonuclease [Chloroflexota bacterium]|nr:Uma2 family endonuclease [Chloroflexota bacterium]